jgi:hypothetical protein
VKKGRLLDGRKWDYEPLAAIKFHVRIRGAPCVGFFSCHIDLSFLLVCDGRASSDLLPSSGGVGRRRTISYLERYACHVDLSNRCYQCHPSLEPIVSKEPDRRHSATGEGSTSRNAVTFGDVSDVDAHRLGRWVASVGTVGRETSVTSMVFSSGGSRTASSCTGPSGALLTQMLDVESGVIEKSRKPDPDPVAGEPSPAWPGTYGSTFN